jgi:hypothetical protein
MRINPITMLITNFTEQERKEMLKYAEDLVVRGLLPSPDPPWVTEWRNVCGFLDSSKWLLVVATALPQRILLSLLLDKKV